jgi:hypothetical protein
MENSAVFMPGMRATTAAVSGHSRQLRLARTP